MALIGRLQSVPAWHAVVAGPAVPRGARQSSATECAEAFRTQVLPRSLFLRMLVNLDKATHILI
jgi:hypothetical protein